MSWFLLVVSTYINYTHKTTKLHTNVCTIVGFNFSKDVFVWTVLSCQMVVRNLFSLFFGYLETILLCLAKFSQANGKYWDWGTPLIYLFFLLSHEPPDLPPVPVTASPLPFAISSYASMEECQHWPATISVVPSIVHPKAFSPQFASLVSGVDLNVFCSKRDLYIRSLDAEPLVSFLNSP